MSRTGILATLFGLTLMSCGGGGGGADTPEAAFEKEKGRSIIKVRLAGFPCSAG